MVRTNCLDCLDRTNVFMTKVALKAVEGVLRAIGVNIAHEFKCQTLLEVVVVGGGIFNVKAGTEECHSSFVQ